MAEKIVMLTCPLAETICTGASCFNAFYRRTHSFRRYGKEELEIGAFMKCSGCGHYPGEDKGLDEKIERIINMKPKAVHLGICCCKNATSEKICDEIKAITDIFEKEGIKIIRGTHSEF